MAGFRAAVPTSRGRASRGRWWLAVGGASLLALHPLACGEPLVLEEEENRPDASGDAPMGSADATPGNEDETREASGPSGPPPEHCRRTDAGLVCGCPTPNECEIDCSGAEPCLEIVCATSTQCKVRCKTGETVQCSGTCDVEGCPCAKVNLVGQCLED